MVSRNDAWVAMYSQWLRDHTSERARFAGYLGQSSQSAELEFKSNPPRTSLQEARLTEALSRGIQLGNVSHFVLVPNAPFSTRTSKDRI